MQKSAVDAIRENSRQRTAEVVQKVKRVRLYILEEQELLRETYKTSFPFETGIEVVGLSAAVEPESLGRVLAILRPDVLLIGTKVLQAAFIDKLEASWGKSPCAGIVLLSALYEVNSIKRLRAFARKTGSGCAYLFKHSIDNIGQLAGVIQAVSQGRVIVDPMIMAGLIEAGESRATTLLKELSPWELEVFNWMAKGFTDHTIAGILALELKTVERYVNIIYSKIGPTSGAKDPRVNAINLYLKATGQLPNDELTDE